MNDNLLRPPAHYLILGGMGEGQPIDFQLNHIQEFATRINCPVLANIHGVQCYFAPNIQLKNSFIYSIEQLKAEMHIKGKEYPVLYCY
jgi:hypothetical protein